jgi:biotin carboxyl carrier protein
MTFEVDIAGRTRTVAIEAVGTPGEDGGAFRVTVDGNLVKIDARRTELGLSLVMDQSSAAPPAANHSSVRAMDDEPTAGRCRSVDVALTERGRGEWFVQLPHVALEAAVDRRRHQASSGVVERTGTQRVKAPMPGRVLRVLVKVGDDVSAGQGLVVVEAMKMENELRAQSAGRVVEVAVAEGASVEAGRLLVVIE